MVRCTARCGFPGIARAGTEWIHPSGGVRHVDGGSLVERLLQAVQPHRGVRVQLECCRARFVGLLRPSVHGAGRRHRFEAAVLVLDGDRSSADVRKQLHRGISHSAERLRQVTRPQGGVKLGHHRHEVTAVGHELDGTQKRVHVRPGNRDHALGVRSSGSSVATVVRRVNFQVVPEDDGDGTVSDIVKPPGYNTPVPAKILTSDRVETRIGTLEFDDGLPTAATTQIVYDHLDFIRGVEAFLNCVPAASVEAMRIGMEGVGVTSCHQVAIADQLLDSNPLFLTGNTDTVYVSGILDLERDGPTVVEIPPGCGPTTVNDAWFRFVTDMGRPGPDRGEGGKYLIVPAGYDGPVPDGHFVAESRSRINWLIMRGLLVDGKPDAPTKNFQDGLRVYPLSQAEAPPAMEFISLSGKEFNTIHANDVTFFDELDAVVQREPLAVIDDETRGLLASIGIIKGHPFAPDDRMRALLTDAVAVANGTARAISFQTRDPKAYKYPNSQWKTAFIGDDYRWLIDDGVGGRNLDARTLFFYLATVNTPAMALKIPGVGSQYAFTEHDSTGEYLDGAKSYGLHSSARRPGQGLLVDRRLRHPDPLRATDRATIPEQEQHPRRARCRTRMARSPSLSARPRPARTPATGPRPSPARSGSPSCASMAPSLPGSTTPGCQARSNHSSLNRRPRPTC